MQPDWIKKRRVLLLATASVMALFTIGWKMSDQVPAWKNDPGNPIAIYKVQTAKPVLALTFDISWGEKRTLPILEVLKHKGVKKATFFLSSPWAQSHPEIVKEIQEAGFEIANHGHKHVNYSELSDKEIAQQIQMSDEILKKVTGTSPKLLRLPNGDFDNRVLKIASQNGYSVIQWDTDSHDWMNKGVDSIIHRVVSKAHAGDIILMHASDSCKQTHLALPVIIDKLREKGLQFATVSELIHITDPAIQVPKPKASP